MGAEHAGLVVFLRGFSPRPRGWGSLCRVDGDPLTSLQGRGSGDPFTGRTACDFSAARIAKTAPRNEVPAAAVIHGRTHPPVTDPREGHRCSVCGEHAAYGFSRRGFRCNPLRRGIAARIGTRASGYGPHGMDGQVPHLKA
jgi:hypothetical protein